jgi:hypothetical protein
LENSFLKENKKQTEIKEKNKTKKNVEVGKSYFPSLLAKTEPVSFVVVLC